MIWCLRSCGRLQCPTALTTHTNHHHHHHRRSHRSRLPETRTGETRPDRSERSAWKNSLNTSRSTKGTDCATLDPSFSSASPRDQIPGNKLKLVDRHWSCILVSQRTSFFGLHYCPTEPPSPACDPLQSSANDWSTGDCHLQVAFSLRIASRLPINEVCRGGSIPTLELTYKPCRHCSPPTPAPPPLSRLIDSESGVFLTEFETLDGADTAVDNAAVDTPGPWHADCECKCSCRSERRCCQAELAVLFLIPKEIKHQPNEHILWPVPPAKRPKKPPQLTGVTLAEHGLPTMQAMADDCGRRGRGRLPEHDSRVAVHQSLLLSSFDQSPYLDLKITEPSLQLEWQSGR
ncbi:hypothetical protein GQ607_010959 [Colletotrichum asianum]|uniref:C2H2-type domain-containing protein n=1 Tax=Colletotrichum asianum TaxID=702518 RepID=A0A8H3W8L7_9PEZI|nr:hypothetical protein GQ607_010959 [Colletotrichum asianum]